MKPLDWLDEQNQARRRDDQTSVDYAEPNIFGGGAGAVAVDVDTR